MATTKHVGPSTPKTEELPSYYKMISAPSPGSIEMPRRVDDYITIQKVLNGWIVKILPLNVPPEYAEIEMLVFNNLQDMFEAIKIFYEQET